MVESDSVFTGSIPEIYDSYLVPLIFTSYAADLAARVASTSPARVLETAAGSGVVTRALAPRLGPGCDYTVTDLNGPMIELAASRQPGDPRLRFQTADALNLPFDDDSFDVVCCQFGVMFFPDRVAGYREARRVLRPGGRFVFNVWDRIEENVFADMVTDAIAHLFPDDPPTFLARTPHGYHDKETIGAEVEAAGFSGVQLDTVADESPAPSPMHPAIAYCKGTPLRNEVEARDPALLEEATVVATQAIAERYGTGPVSAKIQAHIVTATA
ncbi:class I SAM-dependent methyltransferase [Rhodobacteraceae bacterium NNCM2]|nr:class I SAM-dependent methyltransferase [Coraliihabitans acroporae]